MKPVAKIMIVFPNTLRVCHWLAKQLVPLKTRSFSYLTPQASIVRTIICIFFSLIVLFFFLNDYSFTTFPQFNCSCFMKQNPLEDLWTWCCCLYFHFLCHFQNHCSVCSTQFRQFSLAGAWFPGSRMFAMTTVCLKSYLSDITCFSL